MMSNVQIDSSCVASSNYVANSLDLLLSFFLKRNKFSLDFILILLSYSFTFPCGEPQIETNLSFAYQIQDWT
jgi:hypothetical protein